MRLTARPLPLLMIAMSLTLAVHPARAGQAVDLGHNAALKYYQAYAKMPQLSDQARHTLQATADVPLSPDAAKIVEDFGSALKLMHQGAAIGPCDWGLDESEGLGLLFPPLTSARELGHAAVLRAQVRMAGGDVDGAVDDLLATMKLAHHVGDHPSPIESLVEYAINDDVVSHAAADLHAMTAPQRSAFATAVAQLPAAHSIARAMQYEKSTYVGWLRSLVKKGHVDDLGQDRYSKAWRDLLLNPAKARPAIDRLAAIYDQQISALKQPYALAMQRLTELQTQLDAAGEKFKQNPQSDATDMFIASIVPDIRRARSVQASAEIQRAMLLAAIKYADDGPDAAAKIVDPITGKPFTITPLADKPGWIELASDITFNDKPIALRAHVK